MKTSSEVDLKTMCLRYIRGATPANNKESSLLSRARESTRDSRVSSNLQFLSGMRISCQEARNRTNRERQLCSSKEACASPAGRETGQRVSGTQTKHQHARRHTNSMVVVRCTIK